MFKIGHYYTRKEIYDVCGGEIQSYLPQVNGKIVCGCFTRKYNPNTPNEVFVGKPPKVQKKAKMLSQQGNSIPVFIKDTSLVGKQKEIWEYFGLYNCTALLDDKKTLLDAERRSGRHGELAYVLRLKNIDE